MAICGLSLGLATLGNLLLPYGAWIRWVCGILSAIVLAMFLLKIALDFPHANAELKTPVPLSVLPTSTMALMLLCTYIRPFIGDAAIYLWYVAVIAHVCIMLLFFKRFLLGFKIGAVFPSWFIAFVGIVVVSVTAPAMGARPIGQAAFYIGFTLYFVSLGLVLYRALKPIYVTEPLRMCTAIYTAPMSLCVVGYFSSFEQRNEMLVYTMLAIAAISYIYVSVKMLSLLHVKFYPTYSAFTFPYVISALAFRLGNAFLAERGISFFAPLAQISVWLAAAIVVYVFVQYIKFFRFILKF
jgi:exfoliative toxin A/B